MIILPNMEVILVHLEIKMVMGILDNKGDIGIMAMANMETTAAGSMGIVSMETMMIGSMETMTMAIIRAINPIVETDMIGEIGMTVTD